MVIFCNNPIHCQTCNLEKRLLATSKTHVDTNDGIIIPIPSWFLLFVSWEWELRGWILKGGNIEKAVRKIVWKGERVCTNVTALLFLIIWTFSCANWHTTWLSYKVMLLYVWSRPGELLTTHNFTPIRSKFSLDENNFDVSLCSFRIQILTSNQLNNKLPWIQLMHVDLRCILKLKLQHECKCEITNHLRFPFNWILKISCKPRL